MRRKTVTFSSAPGEVTSQSLAKVWAGMRLGHSWSRKKESVRAFVLSADLFAPNVAKHGAAGRLDEGTALDAAATKNLVDFIMSRRHKKRHRVIFRREEQAMSTGV